MPNFTKTLKSWGAAAILALLVICMAFLGFGKFDPFGASNSGSWIVKAGSRTVDSFEFASVFKRSKKRAEQQYQQQISNEQAVQGGFDRQVLDELVQNEALSALFEKMGLKVPDALIKDAMKTQLAQMPGLFDSITGNLDEDAFRRLLQENDFTPEEFQKGLGDNILRDQVFGAMTAGLKVPRIYASLQGAFGLEQRDVSYFIITPGSVPRAPPPTDAEMQAFLNQNASRLMRPEFRQLTVVRFSAEDYKGEVKADPAEVEKRFNFRKDTLSAPETRSFVQIPVKNDKMAAEAIARLNKGEDAAAIAKSLGVTLVTFDDKPRSALFDKTIGDAAFALPFGGVSAALKGELGEAVLKVTRITPGKAANLEEHRAEIEKDVIAAAAANKAYAQAQAWDDAHSRGANLAQAATQTGAKVMTIGPVTADGKDANGQPVAGISKELLQTAFGLQSGSDSQLVEITAGDQFAVRVEKIIPPAPPALDAVRPELSRIMIAQKETKLMQDRAEALSARLRKGESVEAVAATFSYPVVKLTGLSRATAQAHKDLGGDVLQAAFDGAQGQVFSAGVPKQGLAIAKIQAIRPGDVREVAAMTEQQRPSFTQQVFQDIIPTTAAYAKAEIKPKSSRDRALQALGLDPKEYADKAEDEAKSGKKDAKGK